MLYTEVLQIEVFVDWLILCIIFLKASGVADHYNYLLHESLNDYEHLLIL